MANHQSKGSNRMSNRIEKKEVKMLSGSIMKGLLRICVPIMIMNVVMTLFNIVDMTVLRIFDTGNGFAVGSVGEIFSHKPPACNSPVIGGTHRRHSVDGLHYFKSAPSAVLAAVP